MKTRTLMLIVTAIIMILFVNSNVFAQDQPSPQDRFKAMFEERDTDKDGKISLAEQLAECQKRCKERFKRTDVNGDGFITQQEEQEAFKHVRERNKQRMKKKFGDRPSIPKVY